MRDICDRRNKCVCDYLCVPVMSKRSLLSTGNRTGKEKWLWSLPFRYKYISRFDASKKVGWIEVQVDDGELWKEEITKYSSRRKKAELEVSDGRFVYGKRLIYSRESEQ